MGRRVPGAQAIVPDARANALASSPRQTFVLFPALTLFSQILARRIAIHGYGVPLMVAGYLLYRGAGRYREAHHAGPRGFAQPPDRLLTSGPYAYTRNPMYLGHLLFLTGLVVTSRSPVALLCFLWQLARLSDRVRVDEERLETKFGDDYRAYVTRVPRWLI